MNRVVDHPLVSMLRDLKGNARGCVYTEPLWGIPFNLYAPYASIYMLSFGLVDSQIGLIVSIGLAFQIIFALLSGAITDKLGRRKTTLIFDALSWSIPTFIWAIAQNFNYFLIAAMINSVWRVTHTSWSCLLVEDAKQEQLVDIYSWIYISGLLSAFVAPLAGLLINRFTLIPAVRGLYGLAFVMMTIKFIATYRMTTETRQGLVRMEQTRHQSLLALLGEYRGVVGQILKTPETLYTLGVMLIMSATSTINGTFWSILVTEKLHIQAEHLAWYSFARSVTMLLFFFLVMPRIRGLNFKNPMLIGLVGFITNQLILISIPEKSYFLLLLGVIIDACSFAAFGIFLDKMVVITVNPQERARMLSIMYVIVLVFISPMGWIGGKLSEVNRNFPFMLDIIAFALCFLLIFATPIRKSEEDLETYQTVP